MRSGCHHPHGGAAVSSRRGLLLLLAFLETVCTRVGISQGYDQAFIQTDSELRYLVDGGASSSSSSSGPSANSLSDDLVRGYEDEDGTITVLGSPIRFEPPELDFQEQPLGMPILRKVRVHNLNMQSSIQMLSISGNTIHFHCSFFTDKVIPPSGNTTFDVVFLGREEGPVENTLYIHTSAGSFRFVVRASGTPNPYRLKPLVGVRMPLNSSFSPLIEMHNPHSEPIQVLEMYSSGGDLHLELPSGETEGPQALWQIPPYQTKSVMKANFVARMENNHTAYIRIKTNTTGAEFLYLPLEIEVSSQPGIYCPQELIDFGMLPTGSDPRTVKLLVLNSGNKPIPIQNVIATPVTEALTINFSPVKVASDTLRPSVIAEITFDPSLVSEEGLYTGKIVIKSRNSQFKVTLPYRAHVLHGRLRVNESSTHFHLREGQEPTEAEIDLQESRIVSVTNEFRSPVVVHKVSLPPKARRFFALSAGFKPVVLLPGQTVGLVGLTLKAAAWRERLLDSHLTFHTNVSNMDVKLICFHGKLSTFFPGSPSQELLDFGTLGMGERRDLYFTILNRNPVAVTLHASGSNLTGSLVELMGVAEGNETQILQRQNFSDMPRSRLILPGHYMVFRIGILTKEEEGEINASVFVETDHHEFDVQYRFKVARGSLHTVPRELVFDPVFPGKRVELKLKVFSSFAQEMITDSISPVPRDPRFVFEPDSKGSKILSGQKNYLGKVIFDPAAVCRKEESCYAGFSTTGKFGREWFQGLTLNPGMADADISIMQTLYNRLRETVHPTSSFNITLNLDTDQVRGFLFKARASLVWPRVLGSTVSPAAAAESGGSGGTGGSGSVGEDGLVQFPLTQVGNSSFRDVVINNPSNVDVYFHLVPFSVYPNGLKVANMLPNRNKELKDSALNFSTHHPDTFRVLSVLDSNTKTPLRSFCDEVESRLGSTVHADTKAFVLSPGHSAKVRLRFRPSTAESFRSAVFVRNNLTGVEVIELAAQSVYGSVTFGSYKSGGNGMGEQEPMKFEVTEKLFKDCNPETRKSRYNYPMLTVRGRFRFKNTGMTPVYVGGFAIEGEPCEGFGFKVLNCDPFSLKPEEQREIDIAFSPDFTLSAVSRRLSIHTSLSPQRILNFTMEATVPASLISQCAASLPRPHWESYLYYGINAFMLLLFCCVIFAAFCESDRIARCTIMLPLLHRAAVDNGQLIPPDAAPFDLRGISQQVNNELRQRNSPSSPLMRLRGNDGRLKQQAVVDQRGQANNNTRQAVAESNHNQSWVAKVWTSICGLLSRPFKTTDKADKLPVQQQPPQTTTSPMTPTSSISNLKSGLSGKLALNAKQLPQQTSKKKKLGRKQPLYKSTSNNIVDDDVEETSSTTTESSNQDDESSGGGGGGKGGFNQDNDLIAAFEQSQLQGKKGKNKLGNSNKPNQKQSKETVMSPPSKPTEEDNASKKGKDKPKISKVDNSKIINIPEVKKQPVCAKTSTGSDSNKVSSSIKKLPAEKQQARVKPSEQPSPTILQGSVNAASPSPTLSFDRPPRMQRSTSSGEFDPKTNSSILPIMKQKAKVTPVGKILPEPKKPENLGAQYGPVGAKTYMQPRQSTWTNSPAEARPAQAMFGQIAHPEKPSGGFGSVSPVPAVSPSSSGGPLHRSNSSPYHQQNSSSPQAGIIGGGGNNVDPGGLLQQSPSRTSLMQKLQLERRQRMEDYLREQTDWPGFNDQQTISYIDDLWDTHPLNTAGRRPASRNEQTSWGLEDVWPTASWGLATMPAASEEHMLQQPQRTVDGMQNTLLEDASSGLGFNLLQMASVWGSPTKRQRQEQEEMEQRMQQQQILQQQQQMQQQQMAQQQQQQQQQGNLGHSWSSSLFHKRDPI